MSAAWLTRRPAGQAGQIPALTAIRGLAAWWIVIYHFRDALPAATPGWVMDAASGGYLAVDLFFELSGFVIALNYAAKIRGGGSRKILEFYALRLGRIYPLHIFMLLLFCLNPLAIALFSAKADPGIRYNLEYFGLSALLMQNWGLASELAWNVPAWSISTEWFAYLVFPAMVWLWDRTVRRAWQAVLIAAVLLGGLMAASGGQLGGDIEHFGLLRCVAEFAAGALLFYFARLQPPRGFMVNSVLEVCVGLAIAGCLWRGWTDAYVVPAAFLLLLTSLVQGHSLLAAALSGRLLLLVGEVSYSTYMVHYFAKDWTKLLLVHDNALSNLPLLAYVATTALASAVLYHFVEVPGRRAVRQLVGQRAGGVKHAA